MQVGILMESRAGVNKVDSDAHGAVSSTITSHPWWRCPGFGPENPAEAPGAQSQVHATMNEGGDASKEMQSSRNGSDGNFGSEQHHLQPVPSVVPPMMPEYLVPHTQACAPYPYTDPYAGMMTAYGPQALVHPQLLGLPHTRMALPPEMAEEPVYVNAKQYHGILRRRQSRAKAELEKKVIKARKPYLHESRHQHAMRRARGCGGRFLNTKKTEGDAANPTSDGVNSGASNQAQSASSSDCSANAGSASSVAAMSMQGMYEQHNYMSNSNHTINHDVYQQQQQGHQRGGGMLVNRPPNRAVAIQ